MVKQKRKIDKVTIISIILILIFPSISLLVLDGVRSQTDIFQAICLGVGCLYGISYITKKIIDSIKSHEKYTKSKTYMDNRVELLKKLKRKIKLNSRKKIVIYANYELISTINKISNGKAVIREEEEDIITAFTDYKDFDLIILYPSEEKRLLYFIIATDKICFLNQKNVYLYGEGKKLRKDLDYYTEAIDCFYKNIWIVIKDIIYKT